MIQKFLCSLSSVRFPSDKRLASFLFTVQIWLLEKSLNTRNLWTIYLFFSSSGNRNIPLTWRLTVRDCSSMSSQLSLSDAVLFDIMLRFQRGRYQRIERWIKNNKPLNASLVRRLSLLLWSSRSETKVLGHHLNVHRASPWATSRGQRSGSGDGRRTVTKNYFPVLGRPAFSNQLGLWYSAFASLDFLEFSKAAVVWWLR